MGASDAIMANKNKIDKNAWKNVEDKKTNNTSQQSDGRKIQPTFNTPTTPKKSSSSSSGSSSGRSSGGRSSNSGGKTRGSGSSSGGGSSSSGSKSSSGSGSNSGSSKSSSGNNSSSDIFGKSTDRKNTFGTSSTNSGNAMTQKSSTFSQAENKQKQTKAKSYEFTADWSSNPTTNRRTFGNYSGSPSFKTSQKVSDSSSNMSENPTLSRRTFTPSNITQPSYAQKMQQRQAKAAETRNEVINGIKNFFAPTTNAVKNSGKDLAGATKSIRMIDSIYASKAAKNAAQDASNTATDTSKPTANYYKGTPSFNASKNPNNTDTAQSLGRTPTVPKFSPKNTTQQNPSASERAKANVGGAIGTFNKGVAQAVQFVTKPINELEKVVTNSDYFKKSQADFSKKIDDNVKNATLNKMLHFLTGTDGNANPDLLYKISDYYTNDSNKKLATQQEVNHRADATGSGASQWLQKHTGQGVNEFLGNTLNVGVQQVSDLFFARAFEAAGLSEKGIDYATKHLARVNAAGNGIKKIGAQAVNAAEDMSKNSIFWSSLAHELPNDIDETTKIIKEKREKNGQKWTLKDTASAATIGTLAALINSGIEVGGGEGSGIDKFVKEGGGRSLRRAVMDWGISSLEEGYEEVAQGYVSRAFNKLASNNGKLSDVVSLTNEDAVINPRVMAQEFGMGAGASAILGAGTMGARAVRNQAERTRGIYNLGKELNENGYAENVIQEGQKAGVNQTAKQYADKLAAHQEAGKKVSNWNIGNQAVQNTAADVENLQLAQAMNKTIGANVSIRNDMDANVNGNVDLETRQIDISTDADTSIPETIKHEINHLLKKYAPEQYAKFQEHILAAAESNDAEAVSARRAQLIKNGYSNAQIDEELASELTEPFLKNQRAINRLAESKPNFADKALDIVSSAKASIKDFAGQTYKAANGVELTYTQLEQAERMWTDAIRAVGTVGTESGTVGTESGTVGTDTEGREYSIKTDNNGRKYVEIDNSVLNGVPRKDWCKTVTKWLNQNIQGQSFITRSDGFVMDTNRRFTREYARGANSQKIYGTPEFEAKMNLAGNMDEAIETSRKGHTASDAKKPDGSLKHGEFAKYGWDYRKIYFEYNGKMYTGDLNVAKNDVGNFVYDVTNINGVTFARKPLQSKSLRLKNATPSNNSITQTNTNVNGNLQTRSSLKDVIVPDYSDITDAYYNSGNIDQSEYPKAEFRERMNEGAQLIREAVNDNYSPETLQRATDLFNDIASDIVNNSYRNTTDEHILTRHREAENVLKRMPITLSDTQRGGELGESYNNFRKQNWGKLRIVAEGGTPAGEAYDSMRAEYPEFFPEVKGDIEAVQRLSEFVNEKPQNNRKRMYSEDDITSISAELMNEMGNRVLATMPEANNTVPTDEDGNRMKLSQLYTNTMHKAHYNDEFIAEAESRENEFAYTPTSNKADYEAAQARIENEGADAVMNGLHTAQTWSAKETNEALALVEHYNQQGNYSRAVDVYELARDHATTAGQAIQAWSVVNHLTPEGQYVAFRRDNEKIIERQIERRDPDVQRRIRDDIRRARELDRREAAERHENTRRTEENTADRPVFGRQEELDTGAPEAQTETNDADGFGENEPALDRPVFGRQEELDISAPETETNTRHGETIAPEEFGIYSNYFEEAEELEAREREAEEAEREERQRSHLDDVLDMWNIGHINGSQCTEAYNALRDISDLNSKEDLIDLIMRQSEERHTATETRLGRFARRAAQRVTGRQVNSALVNSLEAQDIELLKQVAIQQVFGKVADATPSTLASRVSTFQTIQHLLNVRTMGRNVVSNALFNSVDTAATDVGAVIDCIMGAFSGKRTVAFQRGMAERGAYNARFRNAQRAYIDIALDVDTGAAEGSKYNGLETSRRTFKGQGGVISRGIAGVERGLSYGLNVTDEWTKGGIEYNIIKSLERLRDSGHARYSDDEIKEIAESEARYRTFQDDTVIARFLTGLKAAGNIIGFGDVQQQYGPLQVHEFGAGDIIQKYTRVPGNLISRFLEYSPTGYLRAIANVGQAIHAHRQGCNFSNEQQRNIAMSFGRAITGTGFMAAFYLLSKLGIFTGEREDETDEQKNLENSEGISSTQLNLSALNRYITSGFKDTSGNQDGDTLVTLGFLEPLNTLMAMGYGLAVSDGSGAGKVANVVGAKVFDQVLDMSTMSTMSSIFNTINYGGSGTDVAVTVAVSGLTGFEGSLPRQLASFLDTSARNAYTNEGTLGNSLDQLKMNIPWLRNSVNERITPFGETKTNTAGNRVMDFFNSFLNPGSVSHFQTTDVSQELYRLSDYDEGVIPSKAPSSFSVSGSKFKLYTDDYEEFARLYGQTAYNNIKAMVDSDYYAELSDDDKASAISDIVSKSATAAKKEWAQTHGGETTAASSSGSNSDTVEYDGTEYTLSPATQVKYNRAVDAKKSEYQNALTSGAKSVGDVLGEYKANYYYNDLTEAEQQKYIAEYDKKINNAKGGKSSTKEELQKKYREEKQKFINGESYKQIEVSGNYSDYPESIQKQILKHADNVAKKDVQAEMKDEIISGGAVESSTTSASRPTFTPSPAAAQQLSSTADKPTAQLLSFESGNKQNSTEQTRPVFGSDNVKWSVSPSTGASIHRNVFSGNKGTTVQGVVINNLQNNNAPEQVQEQTQERKTFRSSSRSSRSRRGSSGSGRSRSGGSGSRSSGSSGIVYSSNLDSNLDNNLDNYSRPNSASSGGTSATSGIVYGNSSGASYSSPSYSSASYSYQPYTSPERYISKGYSQRAADSISNRFSSWYNPIVLFNQRIDDIIPNWWLTGDNGLVKVSGYFSDFDADMQQRILDTLEQKAEDEENNVI